MRVVPTELPGVLVIEPDVHRDARGFFLETYHADRFRAAGIPDVFLQDNHSRSSINTVRGLHLQVRRPQAKLIRVIEGEIYDVAVDVRRGSPMFGRWVAVALSADNFRLCYIPAGFAHGFLTLTDDTEVAYRMGTRYVPEAARGLRWDDPRFGIPWPARPAVISERDATYPDVDPELSDA